MRIAIVTDAWIPQVNGVVRTLLATRAQLEKQFAVLPGVLQISPALEGQLPTLLQRVKEFQFEGLIAKKRDSALRGKGFTISAAASSCGCASDLTSSVLCAASSLRSAAVSAPLGAR